MEGKGLSLIIQHFELGVTVHHVVQPDGVILWEKSTFYGPMMKQTLNTVTSSSLWEKRFYCQIINIINSSKHVMKFKILILQLLLKITFPKMSNSFFHELHFFFINSIKSVIQVSPDNWLNTCLCITFHQCWHYQGKITISTSFYQNASGCTGGKHHNGL